MTSSTTTQTRSDSNSDRQKRVPYKFETFRTSNLQYSSKLAVATEGEFPAPTEDQVNNMIPVYKKLADKLLSKYEQKYGSFVDNDDDDSPPKQIWIGIAGGPGSGKTTSAERIADLLNEEYQKQCGTSEADEIAIVVPIDGYHLTQRRLTELFGEDAMLRRGAPWTFDVEACSKDLHAAKLKGEASLPIYDRAISNPRVAGVQLSKQHKFIFVEGLYLLYKEDDEIKDQCKPENVDADEPCEIGSGWGILYDLWDERWFVRAPSREVQRDRLIQRSLKTWSEPKAKIWGEGKEGAAKRVDTNDVRNMDLIAPHEKEADEVIVTK